MRNHSIVALAAVLLASSLAACGPRVRPEMVARVDAVFAHYGEGAADVPAPGATFEPRAWEVGQWAIYRTRDSKGNPGVYRMAIIREDSCGIWLEQVTQSYSEHSLVRMCFSEAPDFTRRDDAAIQNAIDLVVLMESQTDGGRVETFDFRLPENAPARMMLRSMGANLFFTVESQDAPRDDVRVPAGTFRQTFVVKSHLRMGPFRRDYTNYLHPAVPINGAVRSLDDSGATDFQLIAWGEGATDLDAPWPAE
jgi:hypothetical protein